MRQRARHAAPAPVSRHLAAPGRPRALVISGAALAAAVVLGGIGWAASQGGGAAPAPGHTAASGASARPAPGAGHPRPAPSGRAATGLPSLTAAQLAGQRVIYSYNGLTPPASLLDWIRHGEVGGIIFFTPNVSSLSQLAGVTRELDQANDSPGNPLRAYPLLLMTDQEGGEVRRLPGEPALSERQIGQSASARTAAHTAGTGAASTLTQAGLNVNLAPVLDVYRAPGDFDDQFARSYSQHPALVSALGASFITAQQAAGVAATAKHFPGLGAAGVSQDTDLRPVTLNVPLTTLRGTDEYPYRAAIAAGVKLVMVSWATYPALDPGLPAGLSPAVVGGELRRRLGFTGVTITDALEAGALKPFGGYGQRAGLAAKAGMDLILCSKQSAYEGEQARLALADGYTSGTLSKTAFQASLHRVLALRASLRPHSG